MRPVDGEVELFDTPVSDIQDGLAVEGTAITGTSKYLETGDIADYWGDGNFFSVEFDAPEGATVKVGMNPSDSGMELQELDEDMNGVFKITDKDTQTFRVEITLADGQVKTIDYDLSGITLEGME